MCLLFTLLVSCITFFIPTIPGKIVFFLTALFLAGYADHLNSRKKDLEIFKRHEKLLSISDKLDKNWKS